MLHGFRGKPPEPGETPSRRVGGAATGNPEREGVGPMVELHMVVPVAVVLAAIGLARKGIP